MKCYCIANFYFDNELIFKKGNYYKCLHPYYYISKDGYTYSFYENFEKYFTTIEQLRDRKLNAILLS